MTIHYSDFTAGWGRRASQPGKHQQCRLVSFRFKITHPCLLLNFPSSFPVQGSGRAVLGEQLLGAAELCMGTSSCWRSFPWAVAVQSSFWGAPARAANTWQPISAGLDLFCSRGVGGRKDILVVLLNISFVCVYPVSMVTEHYLHIPDIDLAAMLLK